RSDRDWSSDVCSSDLHLLTRLQQQIDVTADATLMALLKELRDYPSARPKKAGAPPPPTRDYASIVVPFELETDAGTLAFFSTTTVFGTPVDVTLSELAVESFFPANAAAAEAVPGRV